MAWSTRYVDYVSGFGYLCLLLIDALQSCFVKNKHVEDVEYQRISIYSPFHWRNLRCVWNLLAALDIYAYSWTRFLIGVLQSCFAKNRDFVEYQRIIIHSPFHWHHLRGVWIMLAALDIYSYTWIRFLIGVIQSCFARNRDVEDGEFQKINIYSPFHWHNLRSVWIILATLDIYAYSLSAFYNGVLQKTETLKMWITKQLVYILHCTGIIYAVCRLC